MHTRDDDSFRRQKLLAGGAHNRKVDAPSRHENRDERKRATAEARAHGITLTRKKTINYLRARDGRKTTEKKREKEEKDTRSAVPFPLQDGSLSIMGVCVFVCA